MAKVTFKKRFIPLKIGKGEIVVELLPGQFIFGRFKAEDELGIDGSTIYRWIQKFSTKEYGMITIESNNQYSIITLCNWEQYQNMDDESEQPTNNQRTTNEQPTNNQRTTNEQPTNTNKKDNNVNNVKNVKNKDVEDLFDSVIIFFDENCRPKTEALKKEWCDTLDKLIRIDKKDPEQIKQVIKRARMDDFWRTNFLSVLKLRKKNKDQISYYTVFENKFLGSNNVNNNHIEHHTVITSKTEIR